MAKQQLNSAQAGVPIGTILTTASVVAPDGYLLCYGQNVSRSTYSSLFSSLVPSLGTFTITIASPGVITLSSHGQITGNAVYLTTTGALPTGLSANTIYYVIVSTSSTFRLASTRANAIAGTAINTSGTQSGTHMIWACPYGLGDGSTTFTIPDARGRALVGNDSMGGTEALNVTNPSVTTGGIYGNLGATGGFEVHQLTTAQLAAHTHTQRAEYWSGGTRSQFYLSPGTPTNGSHNNVIEIDGSVPDTGSAGSSNSHNNVQPSIIVNQIIKAL